jgi:hypothetical protein
MFKLPEIHVEKEDLPIKRDTKNPTRFARHSHTIVHPTMHKSITDDLFKKNPSLKKIDEERKKSSTESLTSDSATKELNVLKRSTENLINAEKVDTDANNLKNIKIVDQTDYVLKTFADD